MLNKITKALFVIIILFMFKSIYPVQSTWDEKYFDEPVVYDLVEKTVVIHRDWTYDYKYHAIKRVQKPEALDQNIGEIKFAYNSDYEKVKSFDAYTVYPNGKKYKYSKKQDFAFNSDDGVYSGDRNIVLTMPNVSAGSVIDYEISKECKPRMAGTYYDELFYSGYVPTRDVRYQLSVPRGMKINIQNLNIGITPKIVENREFTVYYWKTNSIDKDRQEKFLPPWDEYAKFVIVSSIKSWSNVNNWYKDLFDKNSNSSEDIKKTVETITIASDAKKEKIQKIVNYIQDNVRYVSLNMNSRGYEPHPAKDVFRNKYGDCKDQSLLLYVMLKEIGIKSYPSLFASYDSYDSSTKLPSPQYFDHVILYLEIDDKPLFLDILEKGYRVGDIPNNLRGAHIFIVNENGGIFKEIPYITADDNADRLELDYQLKDNGDALVENRWYFTPDDSVSLRQMWKSKSSEDWKKEMEKESEDLSHGGLVFTNYYDNIQKEYAPIVQYVRYLEPSPFIRSGNYFVLDNNSLINENYFTERDRENPIAFNVDFVKIKILNYFLPNNFGIVSIPKDLILKSEYCEYSIIYNVIDVHTIKVVGKMRLFRSKWPVEKYNEIKQYFNDVINRSKERIIIKKL